MQGDPSSDPDPGPVLAGGWVTFAGSSLRVVNRPFCVRDRAGAAPKGSAGAWTTAPRGKRRSVALPMWDLWREFHYGRCPCKDASVRWLLSTEPSGQRRGTGTLWNDHPSNTSLLCCKIRLQKRKVFHSPSPNPVGSTAPGPTPLLPPLLLWYPLNIQFFWPALSSTVCTSQHVWSPLVCDLVFIMAVRRAVLLSMFSSIFPQEKP